MSFFFYFILFYLFYFIYFIFFYLENARGKKNFFARGPLFFFLGGGGGRVKTSAFFCGRDLLYLCVCVGGGGGGTGPTVKIFFRKNLE